MTALCDLLESVLCFFRDVKEKNDLGKAKFIIMKLK